MHVKKQTRKKMSFDIWITLLINALLISISPGAGAIVSINSGINYGLKKSYFSIFGLQLGYLIQAFIVIIGLGVIIVKSVWLFNIIKYSGVIYLIYLGLSKIIQKPKALIQSTKEFDFNAKKSFLSAMFINLSNPKATVFLVAFIPQFLNSKESLFEQFILIGLTLTFADVLVMTGYASMASRLKELIKDEKALKIQNVITGVFLIVAALFLSTAHRA